MGNNSIFENSVYDLVKKIPFGRVSTYLLVAKAMVRLENSLSKNESRGVSPFLPLAVGQALKKNSFPISIPCHRVIRSSGHIGGYFGRISGRLINDKISLLKSEGILFSEDLIIIDKLQIYDFDIL